MIRNNGCRAGAPRKRRRGSGGLSQPSFTREFNQPARSSSSAAHSARAAELRTTRTSICQPWGCTATITPDASNHRRKRPVGELGQRDPAGLPAAEHPVQEARAVLCHLRRSQRRTPAGRCPWRPVLLGARGSALVRSGWCVRPVPQGESTDRTLPHVEADRIGPPRRRRLGSTARDLARVKKLADSALRVADERPVDRPGLWVLNGVTRTSSRSSARISLT